MNEYELAEIFLANNLSRYETIQYLKQNQIPLPSPLVFFLGRAYRLPTP